MGEGVERSNELSERGRKQIFLAACAGEFLVLMWSFMLMLDCHRFLLILRIHYSDDNLLLISTVIQRRFLNWLCLVM